MEMYSDLIIVYNFVDAIGETCIFLSGKLGFYYSKKIVVFWRILHILELVITLYEVCKSSMKISALAKVLFIWSVVWTQKVLFVE